MKSAFALFAAAALAVLAAPPQGLAQAPSALAAAQRAGIVGERYDGYLGHTAAASAAVRQQVAAINIRRRTLYIALASRRGVTPQVAAIAAGCQLLSRVGVGGAYLLADGVWRRRAAGQPAPKPDYCD